MVDLPEPLVPTKAALVPDGMEIDTPCQACTRSSIDSATHLGLRDAMQMGALFGKSP